MSLGNPAFCDKKVEYMPSVAGYNSIYKIDILRKFRYDTTYPFNTDDIEINYRLAKNGYKFLYSEKAKIYHRLDETISQFLGHMTIYGKGATNVMKLHKSLPRLYIPIAFTYFAYTTLLPVFMVISNIAT
jgi:GT2 family glycosyltransferase